MPKSKPASSMYTRRVVAAGVPWMLVGRTDPWEQSFRHDVHGLLVVIIGVASTIAAYMQMLLVIAVLNEFGIVVAVAYGVCLIATFVSGALLVYAVNVVRPELATFSVMFMFLQALAIGVLGSWHSNRMVEQIGAGAVSIVIALAASFVGAW